MAYSVPDGSKVFLGTTIDAAKTITAITNASPAVASSVAHGYADGDMVIIKSGWQGISDKVFKVANKTDDTFELAGVDTTSTTAYPVGESAGTAEKVSAFTQIKQTLGLTPSGGDQNFATVSPLEADFDTQIPTSQSAQTLTFDIGDDDSLAGYQALRAAAEVRAIRPMKLVNKNGSTIYYYGYISLNETPTKTKGQVDTVKAMIALLSRPVRYAA